MSVFKVGSNKSSQNNFPSVRPTLDLDFANSKTLDPRITFTRASGGSYVGADGLIKYAGVNEPRFDHDPVTGESLGFLVEEARTNLTLYSGDFSQAHWSKISLSIFTANTIIAPDGTLTGSFIAFQNAASYLTSAQGLQPNTSISAGTNTLSCFAKIGTARYLALGLSNNGGEMSTAVFDLQTGTVNGANSHPSFTVNGTSMVSAGSGWYRCSLTSTYATGMAAHISSSTSVLGGAYYVPNISGDGTSGIYVWGAQVEAGAFPTSYIPTEASSRTRAADNATITGTNFSSWYNQSEGTIFSQFYLDSNRTNTRWVASVGAISTSGSGNTGFLIGRVAHDYLYAECRVNTTPQYLATASFPSSRIAKISYGLKNADQRVAFNGTLASESTGSFAPLSQNRMDIGSLLGIEYLCGTIARLAYYPKRLTNQQLQVLTR